MHAMECAGRELPPEDRVEDMALAWNQVMRPIPDDYLERCYLLAAQSRTGPGLVSPSEIVQAWNEANRSIASRAPADPEGVSLSRQQYLERIADISRRAHAYGYTHSDKYHYQAITGRPPQDWIGERYGGHIPAPAKPVSTAPMTEQERIEWIQHCKSICKGPNGRTLASLLPGS